MMVMVDEEGGGGRGRKRSFVGEGGGVGTRILCRRHPLVQYIRKLQLITVKYNQNYSNKITLIKLIHGKQTYHNLNHITEYGGM